MEFFFNIAILIMSVVVHEVSHGYAASILGDQTARYQGRLTLNPIKHLDFMGSIVIPTISYLLGGFLFGWAKPVPYNPYNLRPGRWSEATVAAAGPAANFSIAVIFGLMMRLAIATETVANPAFIKISAMVVLINILLGVFNLVPIPPLDGSKLLYALFPERLMELRTFFERYGLILVLFFIFFIWQLILPIIAYLFWLVTGIAF